MIDFFNKYVVFGFYKKTFFILMGTFMLFTVIGTLTHEMGHIAVAKYYGLDTELHYGSMNYFDEGEREDKDVIRYFEIFKNNIKAIQKKEDFKEQDEYLRLDKLLDERYPPIKHSIFILIGGPLQTILTSFLGMLILYYRKPKQHIKFKLLDWLGVFLSLFILREVFNVVMAIYRTIVFSESNFYGDEFRISRYYELNEWIIPVITFILGILISLYVIFKVVPIKYRITFIASGLAGGILGFLIWFGGVGKILLP